MILILKKKAMHEPCSYSLHLVSPFNSKQNKHSRRDCVEKFCKDLKELGTEIINFEEKRNDTFSR